MACHRITQRDRDIQDLLDLRQTVVEGKPGYRREVWATEQKKPDGWNFWICVQYWPDIDRELDIKFQWWWGIWEREPIEDWTDPGYCHYWEGPSIYVERAALTAAGP